jgi:hypothetical protein
MSAADHTLIALCAEFDACEREVDTIYDAEPDNDRAEATVALVMQRQFELSGQIAENSAHTPDGIIAIARSVAIHNGGGAHDFAPTQDTTTGRLMTALMREVCLLSGLPAPPGLAGRAAV